MADPMWSGGAQQFQDWAPWIWAIMSDWAKQPFYPDDPPKDPGAFTAQALVICNYPVVGSMYAPFIVQYCVYYQEQWDANPPGSSSSTPELPTFPATPSPDYQLENDWLSLYQILYGAVSDTYGLVNEVKGLCELILDRIAPGEDPPPITTSNDTARILAAVYYTNWLWYNNPPPVSVPDVLEAITDAHAITDAAIAAANLDIDGLATNTQNAFEAQTELINNVSGDVDDVLAAVEALPTSGGDVRYPGSGSVSWGTPQNKTGSANITAATLAPDDHIDGIALSITSVPAGSYEQGAEGVTIHKYQGWLSFYDGDGNCDDLQWLGANKRIYLPVSMRQPSGVVIYAKTGTAYTVTGWAA